MDLWELETNGDFLDFCASIAYVSVNIKSFVVRLDYLILIVSRAMIHCWVFGFILINDSILMTG